MTWHTSQGNADLKSTFAKGRHELNVSTHQMCILLLFNQADVLSYAEIQDATQVSDKSKDEIGLDGMGWEGETAAVFLLIFLCAIYVC